MTAPGDHATSCSPAQSPKSKAATPWRSAAAICADPALTREQKIQHLIDMHRDALELEVAAGEGMMAPSDEASGLGRIQRALEDLGAADRIPPRS